MITPERRCSSKSGGPALALGVRASRYRTDVLGIGGLEEVGVDYRYRRVRVCRNQVVRTRGIARYVRGAIVREEKKYRLLFDVVCGSCPV